MDWVRSNLTAAVSFFCCDRRLWISVRNAWDEQLMGRKVHVANVWSTIQASFLDLSRGVSERIVVGACDTVNHSPLV